MRCDNSWKRPSLPFSMILYALVARKNLQRSVTPYNSWKRGKWKVRLFVPEYTGNRVEIMGPKNFIILQDQRKPGHVSRSF
jgi:hypothetical protein